MTVQHKTVTPYRQVGSIPKNSNLGPLATLFAIGVLSLVQLSSVKAAETPSELIGVWRGILGGKEIVACWDAYNGHYYPLAKSRRVQLYADEQKIDTWIEDPGADDSITLWRIHRDMGTLSGVREDPHARKRDSIYLKQIFRLEKKNTEISPSCTSSGVLYDMFIAPRADAVSMQTGDVRQFMNKKYRAISAFKGKVASVELIGDQKKLVKGNKILRKELKDAIRSYVSCDDFDPPHQGDYASKVHLRFWRDEWLSYSTHVSWYCGGAHPSVGFDTKTLNLNTGKEINLWDWIRLIKKQESDDKSDHNRAGMRIFERSLSSPKA